MYFQTDAWNGLALSYTQFDIDNVCYGTAVAVLVIDDFVRVVEQLSARKEDWEIVYRSDPCLPLKAQSWAINGNNAGGRMTFASPATIYLGNGDYHWDGMHAPEVLAQDGDTHYGKVIAIDLATRQARIVSSGHRNPQGILFDNEGRLWAVEHGMRGGDELNRIVEGANYGWPLETFGTKYDGLPVPSVRSYGRHETFTAPIFAWLPSVAVSNLTQLHNFHESWDGDLLIASLAGRSLFRLRVENDRILFMERIHIGKRIRYVHQHHDGRLVLWTDDRTLMFITATDGTLK